jgi:FtsZ-interacting cell division protein ZipA
VDAALFRWVLIAIAVLLVIAIYLYGLHQSRLRQRDAIESHTREEIDSAFIEDELMRDELDSLTEILRENDGDENLDDIQLDSVGNDRLAASAPRDTEIFLPAELRDRAEDEVISYLLYHDDFRLMTGEEANAACQHAGLDVDDDGYLEFRPENSALFRISSLSEPGHFNDVDQLEFSTVGFNCFIELDRVDDPRQAYETMLKKIDELVRLLNVKVYKANRELLTISDVTEIREKLS